MSEPALQGIRVVELATGVRGPVAARMLAELGAEVVKVEPPAGDPWRGYVPAGFATWNRGKRSVVLDVGTETGRSDLHRLLERADLLIHDLPAGSARAAGLDDATRHPHLVVASAPTYPAGHPRADDELSDSLVQATEGFMDEQQGHRPGPVFVRVPYSSWSAAYLLATGAVARLVQRARTGVVLPISTSLFQGALTAAALYWQRWERLPETLTKHTLPKIDPDAALSIFECADGRWVQLAGAVGGWIESPPVLESLALHDEVELSEVGVTRANQERWNEVFRQHDSEWWATALSDADVPCMIVSELGDCFTSDQAAANHHVTEVDDAVVGRALQAGPPVRTTPAGAVGAPAPALGSSTVDDVLAGWDARPTVPTVPPVAAGGDTRPLAGLRGLDFGTAIAGPYGAQCLGDLGVEVTKVEPLVGDRGRALTQFAGSHRGKRSVALDLKNPSARPVLADLLARADVVLHNMRLAPAARLGLDGPGLRAANPRIAFSHVSAYGTAGAMAALPGYDPTAQAFTGWEHAIAGEGMPPVWLRSSVFDVQAGLAGAFGAVVALLARERTGVPGEAATSLLAVAINASSELVVDPVTGEKSPIEVLTADQTGVSHYHRIHRVADGWVAVAALAPAERDAFDTVPGPLDDRPAAVVLAELRAAGVPAEPVALDALDAFHDAPVHHALGVSRTLQTRGFGRIDLVGGWWDLGPAGPEESVPALGEHTVDVLRELGRTANEIDALIAGRVAGTGRTVPTPG